MRHLVLSQSDPGELSDTANGRLINGHLGSACEGLKAAGVYTTAPSRLSTRAATGRFTEESHMEPRVATLEGLAGFLTRHQRLIGLDLGTKTIGLALSDVERRIATPLDTISRTKFTKDIEILKGFLDRYEVGALVIGLPLNMDGTEGPRVQSTRAFVRQALPLVGRPFAFWDERLSTAAVTRALIEQDVSRARRGIVVDRMAAAYILQGALDRLAALRSQPRGQDDNGTLGRAFNQSAQND